MSIKVSVIVLMYNQEEYIIEAIDSVVNQEYENIELICGDDASSDATLFKLEKYNSMLGVRLIVVKQSVNVGITENFNSCLKMCTGKYIFLLGGDDYFFPGKIKHQVEFMECNPEISISYHDVSVFQSSTREILYYYNSRHKAFSGSADILIRNGTFCCGCSVAVRNVNVPLCNPLIKFSSDWLWMIDILKHNPGTKIAAMNGVYSAYRRHSGNITDYLSRNFLKGLEEVMLTLDIINQQYPEEKVNVSHARAERYFVYGLKAFLSGNFIMSCVLFKRAFGNSILAPILFIRRRLHLGV